MTKVLGDLSVPTTCEYTHVNIHESRELYAYFVFPNGDWLSESGINFVNLFYAAFAGHCTSVAYYIIDGKVHLWMNDDSCLLAWGAGSKNADRTQNRDGEIEQEDDGRRRHPTRGGVSGRRSSEGPRTRSQSNT
jgi:hypothetical protein